MNTRQTTLSSSEATLNSYTTKIPQISSEDVQKAYEDYFFSAYDNREEKFKALSDVLIAYQKRDAGDCVKQYEETILPAFCGVTDDRNHATNFTKHGEHSLAILALLKQLFPELFLKQATDISKNELMMKDFCKVLLKNPKFDDVFKGTPLSVETVISYSLNHLVNKDLPSWEFENYYERFFAFKAELIKALPQLVLSCPAFVLYMHKQSEDLLLNQAIEESLVYYCKTNTKSSYHQKLIIELLCKKNQAKYVPLREAYFSTFSKNASDPRAAMDIVLHLFLTRDKKDLEIAFQCLASLLKVNNEVLHAKDSNPFQNATLDMKERINYLFKHAQADERTQLEVLHMCGSSLDFNRNLSITDFFGGIIRHSTDSIKKPEFDEKCSDKMTNKHYSAVMASLKKPQGISAAQIDTAVAWWSQKLREKAGAKINSTRVKSGYFEIPNPKSFAQFLYSNTREVAEEKIQQFEKILKEKLRTMVGKWHAQLCTDYDAEGLLGEAIKAAKIDSLTALPWKTNMEIEGNTALTAGSIKVNGTLVDEMTLDRQALSTLGEGMRIEAQRKEEISKPALRF